jgi:hypothetical protein
MSRSRRNRWAIRTQPMLPFEDADTTEGLDSRKQRELKAAIAELLVEAIRRDAGEDEENE